MSIKTLEIYFRHLKAVALHDLSELNILIGANNAGKTSILKALRAGREHVIAGYGFQPPPEEEQQDSHRRRLVPTSRAALDQCTAGEGRIFGPIAALERLMWAAREYQFGWRDEPQLRRTEPTPDPRHAHAGIKTEYARARVFRTRDANRSRRDKAEKGPYTEIDEIEVDSYFGSEPSLHEWLSDSFFLWHRRKSSYVDDMGIFPALDQDAVHLAGRLHQLRGERKRDFHEQLTAFIEAVIPGLGEPITRPVERDIDKQRIRPKHYRDDPDQVPGPPGVEIVFDGRDECTLARLGGGVEQVLALAMVLLGEPDRGAVFIEEPESHLHPDAQRRLLEQILLHRGQRQIFITTHSPVFIDSLDGLGRVYRVYRDAEGPGQVELCLQTGHKRRVLDDLGVRASHLLQSNCIIWVEGPTESVLVRAWLAWLAPRLREHRHYEFAYTGGSVLAHLGADVSQADADLRDLFRMCRYNAVICDRDAAPSSEPAKPDIARLRSLAENPGLSDHLHLWVTRGYEIEWYLPRAVVADLWNDAAAEVAYTNPDAHAQPFYKVLASSGQRGTRAAGTRKVHYARRAVDLSVDADQPGARWWRGAHGEHLREQVQALARFISAANGMDT